MKFKKIYIFFIGFICLGLLIANAKAQNTYPDNLFAPDIEDMQYSDYYNDLKVDSPDEYNSYRTYYDNKSLTKKVDYEENIYDNSSLLFGGNLTFNELEDTRLIQSGIGTVQYIESFLGHYGVLELNSTSGEEILMKDERSGDLDTIEFWFYCNDSSSFNRVCLFYGTNIYIMILVSGGHFYYWDSVIGSVDLGVYTITQWNHFRVDFDWDSDETSIYINTVFVLTQSYHSDMYGFQILYLRCLQESQNCYDSIDYSDSSGYYLYRSRHILDYEGYCETGEGQFNYPEYSDILLDSFSEYEESYTFTSGTTDWIGKEDVFWIYDDSNPATINFDGRFYVYEKEDEGLISFYWSAGSERTWTSGDLFQLILHNDEVSENFVTGASLGISFNPQYIGVFPDTHSVYYSTLGEKWFFIQIYYSNITMNYTLKINYEEIDSGSLAFDFNNIRFRLHEQWDNCKFYIDDLFYSNNTEDFYAYRISDNSYINSVEYTKKFNLTESLVEGEIYCPFYSVNSFNKFFIKFGETTDVISLKIYDNDVYAYDYYSGYNYLDSITNGLNYLTILFNETKYSVNVNSFSYSSNFFNKTGNYKINNFSLVSDIFCSNYSVYIMSNITIRINSEIDVSNANLFSMYATEYKTYETTSFTLAQLYFKMQDISEFYNYSVEITNYLYVNPNYKGILSAFLEISKTDIKTIVILKNNSGEYYSNMVNFSMNLDISSDVNSIAISFQTITTAYGDFTNKYGMKIDYFMYRTENVTEYNLETNFKYFFSGAQAQYKEFIFKVGCFGENNLMNNPFLITRYLIADENFEYSDFWTIPSIFYDITTIIIPDIPIIDECENSWDYVYYTLVYDSEEHVIIEEFEYDFVLIKEEVVYAEWCYEANIVDYNNGAWGDWGIFNFLRDFFAMIVNVLYIVLQFLLYLLGATCAIIFSLIGCLIVVLLWNICIYYLFFALVWLVFVGLEYGIELLAQLFEEVIVPILNYLVDEVLPILVDALVGIWSSFIALVLYLLTLGQGNYTDILNAVTSFNNAIADYLVDTFQTVFHNLPVFLVYFVYFFALLGMFYLKFLYVKAKGYVNRAEQLETTINSYMQPVLLVKKGLKAVKDVIWGT